ncbi:MULTISPECIES: DMT family transporter [unclassified Aureimonas]|uniref:DMT family transporter n=1 Tax=unclassified Aureimonas TaxID=2615206 RepID=UPI0009E80CA3|nr:MULTISPECIES: DMT family transporter [unclassified Aureimonas]
MSLTADRPSRAKLVATLAMIASAACWGFATVMSRNLLDAMPPTTLLVIQLTASVAALLVMAAPNFPHRYEGKGIGRAAAIGLLEPGLTYAVGLAGLSLTTAGKASVISASEPVLIVLMSWILFSQRPSRRLLVCIALAVVGVLMVSGVGDLDAGDSERLGDGLIVLATLFAATYVVLSARVAGDFPPATLASSQQLVGLAFALALYAVERLATADPVSITDMPPRVIVYAALSGVVQYAAAFWLYLIGLRHLSAGAAGLWLTLVPVFGLFGAYVWLGEVPTIIMLLGASFILAAVLAGRSES